MSGKCLIVGAGIAGLSTAWALTRRGFAVEVFEHGPVPNPRSSSHDEHRITRHSYGLQAGYARLMPEAFATWDALFADIGARHYDDVPLVVVMREPAPGYAASRATLDELGIACEDLAVDDIVARYPMIAPDAITDAFVSRGAGVLFASRILTDLVVHLASRGVRFHAGALVSAIDPERASLTAGGTEHAGDALVVAAGAWVDHLVPGLRGVAVPSRQAVAYLAPPPDLAALWATAPVIIDLGRASRTYTLPPRPGTRLKVGDHTFSRTGDPDDDRIAADADVASLLAAARGTYRDFDRYTVLERRACFYTVTEDEAFVVAPLGARGYVLSACSGHGFKLAPLMGDRVAATIAGERPPAALADWAAGRQPGGPPMLRETALGGAPNR